MQAWLTELSIGETIITSLVFLPGDLTKVVIATLVTMGLYRAYPRALLEKQSNMPRNLSLVNAPHAIDALAQALQVRAAGGCRSLWTPGPVDKELNVSLPDTAAWAVLLQGPPVPQKSWSHRTKLAGGLWTTGRTIGIKPR